jgi:hypothetical protein
MTFINSYNGKDYVWSVFNSTDGERRHVEAEVPALPLFPSPPDPVCLLQLNGSVGLNIFSAICSAVGIMLFITDISISSGYIYPSYYPYQENLGVVSVLKQRSLPLFSYVQTLPERPCQPSPPTEHCQQRKCSWGQDRV